MLFFSLACIVRYSLGCWWPILCSFFLWILVYVSMVHVLYEKYTLCLGLLLLLLLSFSYCDYLCLYLCVTLIDMCRKVDVCIYCWIIACFIMVLYREHVSLTVIQGWDRCLTSHGLSLRYVMCGTHGRSVIVYLPRILLLQFIIYIPFNYSSACALV